MRTLLILSALLAAVAVVFGQAVHFDFVNFDDTVYVTENHNIARGFNFENIVWAFTHKDCSLYHPLTMISLMADFQLHGLHAGGYHVTNLLLHAASTVLLFLVLQQMTKAPWRSAPAAAIFAIHPLRAESVAWVAERKDVLSVFFFMVTVAAYVWYVRSRSWPRYLAVLFAFLLALLSKPTVVTLPFVLLLLDFWPLGRKLSWKLVLEKVPLLILAAGASLATVLAVGEAVETRASYPMLMRLGNATVSAAVYLRQSVWPSGLIAFYPYPAGGRRVWEIAAACIVLTVISAAAWLFRRKTPWLITGWLWYLGMLTPVIGLVQVGRFAHSDRATYLPQIGLCIILSWAAAEIASRMRWPTIILTGAAVAALALLGAVAHNQAAYWRDGMDLWTHALACNPNNALAENNLGFLLSSRGQDSEAIEHLQKAVRIDPLYPEAHNNLGMVLGRNGRRDEALPHFLEALRLWPGCADAHCNLGSVALENGDLEHAIAEFNQALKLEPEHIDARFNLGIALCSQGRADEGIREYRKALEAKPDNPKVLTNLGLALFGKGDKMGAVAAYQKALELDPEFSDARVKLGALLFASGDVDGAIGQYRRVLESKTNNAEAWNNLGIALFNKGLKKEAVSDYRRALASDPHYAKADYNLANAFASEGRWDEAATYFKKALEIDPAYAYAHCGLGSALMESRNWDDAAAHFRKALELSADYPQARRGLGKALLRKGEFVEAIKCLQTTNNAGVAESTAWDQIGDDFLKAGDLEESLACYQQSLKTGSPDGHVYAKMGVACFENRQIKDAVAFWQHALELAPDQSDVQNNLAWTLATAPDESLRSGARAAALAERARELTQGANPAVLHTLAAAYAELGRYADASATAHHAMELAAVQKDPALHAKLEAEIKLYENHQPLRDAPQ